MIAALAMMCATAAQAGNPPNWRPQDLNTFRPRTPREAMEQVRLELEARATRAGTVRRESPLRASAATEGTWREWAPPTRAFHALIYDSRRDRLVVLGGAAHFGGRGSSWQLPLAGAPRWSPFAPAGAPPAAEHVAAAYDSVNDRVLAFLAISDAPGAPLRSEVWSLALAGSGTWSKLPVSGSPSTHFKQSIALDGSGKRLFLVTVEPGFHPIEAWQLDLASGAWTALSLEGPESQNGFQPDVLMDDRRERLVVSSPVGLWTLSLDRSPEWTRFYEHALEDSRLLYDAAGDRAIVIDSRGRMYVDPLGTPGTPAAENESLSDRTGFAAAWDSRRGRATIHGGWHAQTYQTLSQTLARPAGQTGWTDIGSWSGDARLWHSMVLDPRRDRAVVYGGSWFSNEPLVTRPLTDPLATVTPLAAAPGPRPRAFYGYSIDFDAARDRVLLYGGQAADGTGDLLDELWSLSMEPVAWTKLEPAGSGPGRRYYHTSFFDPAGDRWIVIGGNTSESNPHGAWELRFTPALEWRPLEVEGVSPTLIQRTFVDAGTGEVWAWGTDNVSEGPLWKLTLGPTSLRATRVPLSNAPTASEWYRFTPLSYDPARGRLIVTEEDFNLRSRLSGYWSVALGASAEWRWKETAAGPRPFDRLLEAVLADPARDRMVLYGGFDDNNHYFDDWWSLEWDRTTQVLVSVESALLEHGVARLFWNAQGAEGPLSVQRSRDGGDWVTLASLRADASGRVAYEDATIQPGHRYGYRLLWNGASGPVALGETTIDYAAGTAFAIRGASTNPVTGPLRVAFSLDRAGEARVGLYDVGGRRVLEQRVVADAPGPREMALAPAGQVEPGVYFLRLSDGRRSSAARVVIAR